MLHGWFGDGHAFAPIESALTGGEFTYAFIDYRGYGGMKDVRGDYTIDEIAADVLELVDALGFAQFSLIGHSMGAKAAERVLTRAPTRVRKLVGIAPVPASSVPFDEQGWALFSGAADNPQTATRSSISRPGTDYRGPGSSAWSRIHLPIRCATRSLPI